MRNRTRTTKALSAVLFLMMPLYFTSVFVAFAEGESEQTNVGDSSVLTEDLPAVTVTPVVANEKAKPRDIIKKEITVTNNTGQKLELYITVENVDPNEGAIGFTGPTESDLSTSLANWVEITRGVIELDGGESRTIPYLIHVNLTAKPASYFVEIRLRAGRNRADAESRDGGAVLLLNVEVLDDAKERLQLGTFSSDDSVILGKEVGFSYLLENIGNRIIEPRGSIRIFNRRGEEVGSIPVNAQGVEIAPDNQEQLAAAWSASGRFGKYKAFLDLEYGENQLASVQDTLYFWVFPWKEVAAALIGVLVLAIIGTFIVHMRAVARPSPVRSYASPAAAPPPAAATPNVPRSPQPSAPSPQTLQQTVLASRVTMRQAEPRQAPRRPALARVRSDWLLQSACAGG